MIYRPYTPADRDACLAVFDSNADRFFSPGDRAALAMFLEAPPGFLGVLRDEAVSVAGCGGIGPAKEERVAVLTGGMVHAARHGRGWGRPQTSRPTPARTAARPTRPAAARSSRRNMSK